jgi:hypothetical protein
MRQSDWHHQLELAGRKLPPRLGTIYALGLLAVFMTVVLAFKARWAFSHPEAAEVHRILSEQCGGVGLSRRK